MAVAHIKDNSGKHFDLELVGVFVRELSDVLHIRERFSSLSNTLDQPIVGSSLSRR